MIAESFALAPALVAVRGGCCRQVVSFDAGYAEAMRPLETAERVTWSSPDGLQIQGWLLRPRAAAPFPLILDVHGGPVGHWKPAFLMRRMLHVPLLLSHGFGVFLRIRAAARGVGRSSRAA